MMIRSPATRTARTCELRLLRRQRELAGPVQVAFVAARRAVAGEEAWCLIILFMGDTVVNCIARALPQASYPTETNTHVHTHAQ